MRDQIEIGSGDASGDSGASRLMNTRCGVPHVANFGAEALVAMSAGECMPPSPIPSGGQSAHGDHVTTAASETRASRSLDARSALPSSQTINALIELQKQRVFCIKSQSRCDRSCEAFIARALGYSSPREKDKERSGEKERKALFARAAAMRKAVEKGGHMLCENQGHPAPEVDGEGQSASDSQFSAALSVCTPTKKGGQRVIENHDADAPEAGWDALSACTPIITNSAASRYAWDSLRAQTEKEMRRLVKSLPVYAWTKDVAGFGELGLAIIIGETGDLNNYATKERVWKRLGLAVIEGERQQKRTNTDQAAAHGYTPRRRAEIWTIADSMFKHQWVGAKEDRAAGPSGPYGEVYARRKAHTEGREGWTLAHRDNDARRVMTKALLENLWRVWHGNVPINGDYGDTP